MVELPGKPRRDIARGRNKEHVRRIVDIELNDMLADQIAPYV